LLYSKVNASAQLSHNQENIKQSPLEKSNLIWSVISEGKPRPTSDQLVPHQDLNDI